MATKSKKGSTIMKPLLLSALFTLFYLFFWENYEKEFLFLSVAANNMFASKSLLTLATQTHNTLESRTLLNKAWRWFSIIRTYFIIQVIWNLVSQLIRQRIKYETTSLQHLKLGFIFSHRMTTEIWLEFLFIQGFELLPVKQILSPLLVNFSYFTKIATALGSHRNFTRSVSQISAASSGSALKKLIRDHSMKTLSIG